MANSIEPPLPPMHRLRVEIAPATIFLVLGVVAGVWILGQLATVLWVITISLVLVGTFSPVVTWLGKRGLKRGRALVLVFSVGVLGLAAVALLMVPPLVAQLLNLVADLPKAREDLVKYLGQFSWSKSAVSAIKDMPLDDLAKSAAGRMFDYSSLLFMLVGYGISCLFLAIYLLVDPVRAKSMVYAVVPRHHHVKVAKILIELEAIVGGYMRGQLITSLAIAVFTFILLTILGAENSLAIALFAGITDIIPFVGGYVASTPVVVAVIPNGTTTAIIVGVLMMGYQEFESRILVPRVYGRVLRLPPAVVLVALLVGGTLGGILGALLALPIAAGMQMLIRELRVELPGKLEVPETLHRIDERASEVYEKLSEGVPVEDAAVIADNLAELVRERENQGRTLSGSMTVIPDEDTSKHDGTDAMVPDPTEVVSPPPGKTGARAR